MNRKVVTAIFTLSAVLAISALAQAQSSTGKQTGLSNPSFEEPRGEEASFVLVETMPGWKTTDTHFEIWGTGFKDVVAHEGTQFVELNAYIDGTLYQDSAGIQPDSVLEFTFAHRGRNGDDTMKLTITDLGADNTLDGGDDTVLFTKAYTTGKDAWAVYNSTKEKQIKALGNTVRFAYRAISAAGGEVGEGNFLDAANFGIGVVSMQQPAIGIKAGAWEIHQGGPPVAFNTSDKAGMVSALDKATIPPQKDAGWKQTSDATVNVHEKSAITNKDKTTVDYTFFQVMVTVPEGSKVKTFQVKFDQVDDAARVWIFNSKHPEGKYFLDADVLAGGQNVTVAADFKDEVAEGENRIVITQYDNYPVLNTIKGINVIVNGKAIAAVSEQPIPLISSGATLAFVWSGRVGNNSSAALGGKVVGDNGWRLNGTPLAADTVITFKYTIQDTAKDTDRSPSAGRYTEGTLNVSIPSMGVSSAPNKDYHLMFGTDGSSDYVIAQPFDDTGFGLAGNWPATADPWPNPNVLSTIANPKASAIFGTSPDGKFTLTLKSGDVLTTAFTELLANPVFSSSSSAKPTLVPANAMKLDVDGGAFTFGYSTTAKPGFTEFPNTDSPHPGIKRRNMTAGDYFSFAQNTRETDFKAQESDLVHYPAKAEGSGVLHPGQNPGDVAIARFTAMGDGEYHFKIAAELIEENPTGAGVTIKVDGKVVNQQQLHKHLVPWTTSFQRKLTKGQTVDIAVDNGVEKNWEKDHVLITAKAWTSTKDSNILEVPAPMAQAGFPKGYFYMTTKSAEGQDLVLESAPLILRKRNKFMGMAWKAERDDDGSYFLTSRHLEKTQGLEGDNGQKAATMQPKSNVTGMLWKAVPAGGGYYYLTTLAVEPENKVLDGSVGDADGAEARFKGAPYMVDKKSAGPSALWKFVSIPAE